MGELSEIYAVRSIFREKFGQWGQVQLAGFSQGEGVPGRAYWIKLSQSKVGRVREEDSQPPCPMLW